MQFARVRKYQSVPLAVQSFLRYSRTPLIPKIMSRIFFSLILLLSASGCRKVPDIPARDLFSEVKKGNVELVRRELSQGVSPNFFDREHGFLIQSALFPKSTDMLELLINAGADVNARKLEGDGALLHAVISGECEHARLLLAAGANLNERYGSYYMYAAEVKYKDKTVKQLYSMYKDQFSNAWKEKELCWLNFEKLMSGQ
jgi:ankyrin repeat protein